MSDSHYLYCGKTFFVSHVCGPEITGQVVGQRRQLRGLDEVRDERETLRTRIAYIFGFFFPLIRFLLFASLLFNGNSFYHSHIETRAKKNIYYKKTLLWLCSTIFFFFLRSFCLLFLLLPIFICCQFFFASCSTLYMSSANQGVTVVWVLWLKSKHCWNFRFFQFCNTNKVKLSFISQAQIRK